MSKFIVVPTLDSSFLLKEGRHFLGLTELEAVRQYEVFEFDEGVDIKAALELFDEYQLVDDLSDYDLETSFRYRQVLGQYDERDEMVNRLVQHIVGLDIQLYHSRIIDLPGLTKDQVDVFMGYFINETESEVVPFTELSYDMGVSQGKDLKQVDGFIDFSKEELESFIKDYSMDLSDIEVVQAYFKEEGVNPTIFQLKVIDTYWSDHCRHTTFLTELTHITVEDGKYKEAIEEALAEYNQVRKEVYDDKAKKVTLMDLGTINARYAKKLGLLDNLDESDEVNACCVNIKVDVDGEEEDYLLYFKNETHNHPTEIEPFGGAATCIGGGIRDPLSGRSFVHQALRMSGAADPTRPYEATRAGKLPQRVISQRALEGYSDYSNQIGQTAGFVQEFFDPGFEAKRMELGALVAAAPKENVVRIKPEASDVVILLGGRTGRDGLGAAVGSSMVQTEQSMELQGAEVQKGNPAIERKIMRLFRKPEATRLIKICNDFGAGGVSVAIGELADGLTIELDKVPQKYPGMDPSEIALSESQERMAVVVDKEDVEAFVALAHAEDLEASQVAVVTDSPYMVMNYKGEEVLRLKREFLDSNGGAKEAQAQIVTEDISNKFEDTRDIKEQLSDIQNASQKAIGQNFDYTIGKGTVLAPFGGLNRITPQEGMAAKIPVLEGETKTVSVMAGSFRPRIANDSPFHGAYYAVVNSVAKAVALGVKYEDTRLTMQEFFERMENEEKWGKPTGALLGAFKAMKQLGLAAIGGKDSMSGTFEDLTVPPSVISFAVGTTKVDQVISRELKETDSKVILLAPETTENDIYEAATLTSLFTQVNDLITVGKVRSISTFDDKTIEVNLVEMALGNGIGFEMNTDYLGCKYPLAYLIEVANDEVIEGAVEVARTNHTKEAKLEESYSLEELEEAYTSTFTDVFNDIELVDLAEVKAPLTVPEVKSDVKVLIPVTNGINSEYDLYQTFKQFTPNVDFFIIKEELDYKASIKELGQKLKEYDILALPDGSTFSNRLYHGQAMELFIKDLKDEIEAFIQDKYILAIGSSMAGVIRSGLLEFGRVQEGTSITYKANPYEKFISDVVPANVVKQSEFAEEGSYTTALASYTLAIELDEAKFKDQILAKYARFIDGTVGVDVMTDPSGHILAINSNTERFNEDGINNIETVEAPFIANLVKVAGK